MNPRPHLPACLCGLLVITATAVAQDDPADPVGELLAAGRAAFTMSDAGLTGPGADFLIDEASKARFTLIGERHGTRETPEFTAHLLRALRPAGYDTYCAEIGPVIARHMTAMLQSDDPMAAFKTLNRTRPFTVAFYNWVEECQALIRIHEAGCRVWGLDQEFAGAGRHMLKRLVEIAPDEAASAHAQMWFDKAMAGFQRFATTGDQRAGFMMSATPTDFDDLDAAFAGAPAEAHEIIRELRDSAHVYQLFISGRYYQSNYDRIGLMKRHFHDHVRRFNGGVAPKALFRFGDVHMGRGYSSLNQLDLGNMAAEMACAAGGDSLHLRVYARTSVDADGTEHDLTAVYADYAPAFDLSSETEWVVLDLRPLRPHFHDDRNRSGHEDLADLAFRFDLVVIAPVFHAATEIVPMQLPGG